MNTLPVLLGLSRERGLSRGFSLVEVCLALGIAAFTLLTILSLLPLGIENNQAALRQTEALNIVTGIVEDLRQATPASDPQSSRYGISPTQETSELYLDAAGSPVPRAQAVYHVRISLTRPADGKRNATKATVTLGWPAGSNPLSNSISTFVALDIN